MFLGQNNSNSNSKKFEVTYTPPKYSKAESQKELERWISFYNGILYEKEKGNALLMQYEEALYLDNTFLQSELEKLLQIYVKKNKPKGYDIELYIERQFKRLKEDHNIMKFTLISNINKYTNTSNRELIKRRYEKITKSQPAGYSAILESGASSIYNEINARPEIYSYDYRYPIEKWYLNKLEYLRNTKFKDFVSHQNYYTKELLEKIYNTPYIPQPLDINKE